MKSLDMKINGGLKGMIMGGLEDNYVLGECKMT